MPLGRHIVRMACLVAALACVLTACTSHRHDATDLVTSRGWQEIRPPAPGARVLVVDGGPAELRLFGSVRGGAGYRPAAWRSTDAKTWRPIPVRPTTGYGRQAEFVMARVVGERVVAVGQAYGGAHGNPRPTFWSGTLTGLREYEQPFTLFGGEDAISQNALAAAAGRAVLVGAWDQRTGRYGAAAWISPDGRRWTRYADAAGFASAPGEQTSASDVTSSARGFLAVGRTMRGATTVPLAWWSGTGKQWTREVLPHPSGGATAARVACDADGCIAIGNTTSASPHLRCWRIPRHGAAATGEPGPAGSLIEPSVVVLQARQALVVARIDNRARLFLVDRDCGGWRALPMPVAAPEATVAVLGDRVLLVTTTQTRSRLWSQLAATSPPR